MAMKIEAGKHYRTRDGRKVGPFTRLDTPRAGRFSWVNDRDHAWDDCGAFGLHGGQDSSDLIAEWPAASPVRTVTRKEIVSGVYGRVHVAGPDGTWKGRPVLVALIPHDEPDHKPPFRAAMSEAELRATAATLIELADAITPPREGSEHQMEEAQ